MHLRLASRPPLRPNRIGDLPSLTSKNGGEIIWQGLTPEVSLPAPQKGWPEDVPDFVRPGIPSVPLCLARFKQVRIFGPSVSVASTDGTLFKDVSVEWNSNPEPWPMRKFRFPPARELDGPILLLASTGGETYYHFLFDVLPRLDLAQKAGLDLPSIRHFIVNDLRPAFVPQLLRRAGVPLDRCIELRQFRHLICQDALIPSLPGQMGSPHKEIVRFYARLFPGIDKPAGRGPGLFMSRSGAQQRKIRRESELLDFLQSLGVEIFCPDRLPVEDQASRMARAGFVIAPHGAGLSNLVFCQPGTPVLEIFYPGYINQCYRVLAAMRGLPYFYFIGRALSGRVGKNRPGDSSGDIDLDLEQFRAAVLALKAFTEKPASL